MTKTKKQRKIEEKNFYAYFSGALDHIVENHGKCAIINNMRFPFNRRRQIEDIHSYQSWHLRFMERLIR
jgi:hypothetical protein